MNKTYIGILIIFVNFTSVFAQNTEITTVEYTFLNAYHYGHKPKAILRFQDSYSIFEYNRYEGGDRVRIEENVAVEGFPLLDVTVYDNTDKIGTYQYIDFRKQVIFERRGSSLSKKHYAYLEDSLVMPTWTLIDSSKVLGQYTCKLAETKLWGRKYYAWYAPEIPTSKGPWKLHGLPGLILHAYDLSDKVSWTVKKITFQDSYTFPNIKRKKKTYTLSEFLLKEQKYLKNLLKYMNSSEEEDEEVYGETTIKGEQLEKLDE